MMPFVAQAIHTVSLPCGGHVELRIEGDRRVVIVALPYGGRLELRWGRA